MQTLNRQQILLLIATAIPLLLIPYTFIIQPSGAWVMALLVIPFALHFLAHGRLIPPTPLNSQLTLLLIMVGVSLYATYSFELSISKVTNLTTSIILFWMATSAFSQNKTIYLYSIVLLLFMSLAVAGIALTKTNFSASLPGFGSLVAPLNAAQLRIAPYLPNAVPVFNPNQIAGVLLWSAPFSFILSITALRQIKTLAQQTKPLTLWLGLSTLLGITFVVNVILIFTQSRGAYLGYAVALLTTLVILIGRKRWWLSLIIITIFSLLGGFLLQQIPELTQSGALDTNTVATLSGRLEIWSRAIYGLQDFPFTGMGMNTFREVIHILYPLFLIPPTTDLGHAHNHFLQTGLDLGLPGLIAYLSMWLTLPVILWKTWHQAQEPWHQTIILATTASLTAYFVYGITDTVALGAKPGFVFWWLLATLFALHRLTTKPTS